MHEGPIFPGSSCSCLPTTTWSARSPPSQTSSPPLRLVGPVWWQWWSSTSSRSSKAEPVVFLPKDFPKRFRRHIKTGSGGGNESWGHQRLAKSWTFMKNQRSPRLCAVGRLGKSSWVLCFGRMGTRSLVLMKVKVFLCTLYPKFYRLFFNKISFFVG